MASFQQFLGRARRAGAWSRGHTLRLASVAAVGVLLLAGMTGPAAAQATVGTPEPKPDGRDDAWRFNATVYGWLTSVNGNVTAKGQTFDINAGFFDIIRSSSSVAAFDGYFEANKGPVGFYGDLVWSSLGFSKSAARYRNPLPGLTVSGVANVQATYVMTIVELGGIYEVARWAHGSDTFTAVDALAGLRYWNNSVDATMEASATVNLYNVGLERSFGLAVARADNLEWVDPVLGFRVRHQFAPGQSGFVRGDVGGFGLGSLFSWQAVAAYSYAWQFDGYALAGVLGYRALAANYATGSGLTTRGVDLVLHGPIIGLSLKF